MYFKPLFYDEISYVDRIHKRAGSPSS